MTQEQKRKMLLTTALKKLDSKIMKEVQQRAAEKLLAKAKAGDVKAQVAVKQIQNQ